ncbi:MAG: RnfABCDGE type electron transport complex subunit D [Cocleimonas sp.]|nr:RnfABCDGE type electron transport complex subunit D [Cocleimonas sp.]
MIKKIVIDPRYYQLFVQVSLLVGGVFLLQLPVHWDHLVFTVLAALFTQWAFCQYYQLPLNILSTFNTSLSILLLLHAEHGVWLAIAAVVAIASKFLLRFDQRHLFNPSNIGIVVSLLFFDQVWVAPAQWGHGLWLFLLLAGLLLIPLVGLKAMLSSLSFLISYIILTFLRAIWLGDPFTIPVHELQNGALLLFSFFMLSDPMTTPSHPIARLLFGVLVAVVSVILLWVYYLPNAFLYALACCAISVIPLNRLFQHPRFLWKSPRIFN